MMLFSHQSWFPSWCVLILLQAANAWPTSGIVEIDLIFPHNETYTTSSLMPFVFAIQNPVLASDFYPKPLQFVVSRSSGGEGQVIAGGTVDLNQMQSDLSSNPYLGYAGLTNFTPVEALFRVDWSFIVQNCSGSLSDGNLTVATTEHDRTMWFSTWSGGQAIDLVAATENGTCAAASSQVFDIANAVNLPPGYKNAEGSSECLVLAPPSLPSTTPSPCAVKIDSAAASSISASLTATACYLRRTQFVRCPAPSPTTAAGAGSQSWIGNRAYLLVVFACFASLLE